MNAEEYLGTLFLILSTNFTDLSPTRRSRGEKRYNSSPGRFGPEGDWIYYYPIARRVTCEAEPWYQARV